MTDIDSYLLKCALESLEKGIAADKIEEKCACQMGFVVKKSDETLTS